MLKVDRLVDTHRHIIDERSDIIRAARVQHERGLDIARSVGDCVEVQAACAALAQSCLALALETREKCHFEETVRYCMRAAKLADGFVEGGGAVSRERREAMLCGASINMAIALSGLGERDKAGKLLQAVALRARGNDDDGNFVRAVSNLAEEAGEDEDWDLCEVYVREWVRLARKMEDAVDESDALRKLAVVLREKRDFEGAKEALKRALALGCTKEGNGEARRFLEVVEQDIEERDEEERELAKWQERAGQYEQEGNCVEEAKARLQAGNCAFALKRSEDVVCILERYFVLVDEYGCDPGATKVNEAVHNSAVANIGEAMWKLGRHEQAVHWATRELTVFDGDIPGQAQAWCNLGVYLDDAGKKERAVEALRQSVELAEQGAELEILRRAQNNLEVVEESLKLERAKDAMDVEEVPVTKEGGVHADEHESTRVLDDTTFATSTRKERSESAGGERSIMVISSQPFRKGQSGAKQQTVTACSQDISARRAANEQGWAARSITTRESAKRGSAGNHSRSNRSRGGGTTGDCSSIGFKEVVDLSTEYKNLCAKRHPPIPVRPMIVAALRALSSTLIAREACDEDSQTPAKLNLSLLFLSNHDVSVVFEVLPRIGGDHFVTVDMSLNPMIPAATYECLRRSSLLGLRSLHAIREINLSCAGVTASAFRIVADAVKEGGSLEKVSFMNVSKNAIGMHSRATAFALAQIAVSAANMETVDMSLNLLPNTFISELVEHVERLKRSDNVTQNCRVKKLNFCLNNRCKPTGMLEVEDTTAMVGLFRRLFDSLTDLEIVDVRACGANGELRRSLRKLSDGFDEFSKCIVTVSDTIIDDFT